MNKMGGFDGKVDKPEYKSLSIWMLSAAIPPVLCIAGRGGWLSVLPAALVCAGVCWAAHRYAAVSLPRWLCALELGWLTVILALAAQESGICWGENSNAISIILILLGALSACRGCAPASRAGAVITYLALPILAIVALAGATDINPAWISREMQMPDGALVVLLLVPCLAKFLIRGENQTGKWYIWVPGAVAILAAILIEGTVGPLAADGGFYEFSKSITLFGVAERFEALVACALTLGWFALFSLILSAAYQMLEKIYRPIAPWGVWVLAISAAVLQCVMPENGGWVAVGTLIFWSFLPILTQGVVGRKKVEKKQK